MPPRRKCKSRGRRERNKMRRPASGSDLKEGDIHKGENLEGNKKQNIHANEGNGKESGKGPSSTPTGVYQRVNVSETENTRNATPEPAAKLRRTGWPGEEIFTILKYLLTPEVPELFPLHNAILNRDINKVYVECGMLTLGGLSVDNKDFHGQYEYAFASLGTKTALHVAVENGFTAITKLLLTCKADPAIKDKDGNSALHLAIRKEKDDNHLFGCFTLLIESTHSHKLLTTINDKGLSPLHLAAYNDAMDEVLMIIKAGASINEGDCLSGRTALFHAFEQNNAQVVATLKRAGADKHKKNWAGNSPANSAKKLLLSSQISLLTYMNLMNKN